MSVSLLWATFSLSQTHTIDEENHAKALFYIKKNSDSAYFYVNKMKQSKNQCRALFGMLYEANILYSKNDYESCTKTLDDIISEIDNNPRSNTFIYSKFLVGKTYKQCVDVIRLNVYRRFFFLRKNEKKLTEAYDYLLLMQNSLDKFPKDDIYYLKNKISTTYSMASLKKLLDKGEESLDILLKINKEIDSVVIPANNIWYDNFQKEKANINVLIGDNYMHLKQYNLVELYYDRAYKITLKIDSLNVKNKLSDYYRKAELYYYKKDYKSALNFANKIANESIDEDFNSPLFNIKSKIYSKTKLHDSAIYYSKKMANSNTKGVVYEFNYIYGVLAESYFALNKIDSAYKYSQLSLKSYNKFNIQKNQTLDILNEKELSQAISLNKSIEKKRKENY